MAMLAYRKLRFILEKLVANMWPTGYLVLVIQYKSFQLG